MLDKFLVLLERFVVAHELIAFSINADAIDKEAAAITEAAKTEPEQKAPAKRTRTTKPKAAPEPEQEPEEEEEPVRSPKAGAKAKAKDEPDLATLREEIKAAAIKVSAEGSDKCCDEFDDLLDAYKVRNVSKLHDDDVEDFHAEFKELAGKYFEMED